MAYPPSRTGVPPRDIKEWYAEFLLWLKTISQSQLPLSLSAIGNLKVSVEEGAAGGGIAQTQVRDSAAVWRDVGYASGNEAMPVRTKVGESVFVSSVDLDIRVITESLNRNWVLGSSDVPDLMDRANRVLGKVDIAAFDVELPAGTQNIGDVDIATLPPLPAGTNNIGDVDVLTLPSIPAGANKIGMTEALFRFLTAEPTELTVDTIDLFARVDSVKRLLVNLATPIPAGANNIGGVDVVTMPAVVQSYVGREIVAMPSVVQSYLGRDIISSVLPTGAATEATLAKIPQVPSTLLAGEKIVSSAGTAEPLGSGALTNGVLVQAKLTNLSSIQIGNSSIQRIELLAGENVPLTSNNLDDIYINVTISGEGVNYIGG